MELRTVEVPADDGCVPLFAGQHIEVGTVCVSIDNEADTSAECWGGATGTMTVTYEVTGGWELVETHLAVGESLDDIPANNNGNPRIGHFPFASEDLDGATSHQVTIPLCDLGLSGEADSCDPVEAHFAAHAVVRLADGEGGVQTETAWGDGEPMTGKGSWAEYFTKELTCTPEGTPDKPECEGPMVDQGDEFDGDLSQWTIEHPQTAAVTMNGEQLVMEPAASTQWYGADEALHINQAVSGDFAMTSLVTVTSLDGGPVVPGGPYRIGGLMIRNPESVDVDSYHLGIGNMNTDSMNVTSKSTDDSQSSVGIQDWSGDTAELRICRVGDTVQGLIRLPGQDWSLVDSVTRADLPQTLAAGPIAYAGTDTADLRVTADYVEFMPVATLADCMIDHC